MCVVVWVWAWVPLLLRPVGCCPSRPARNISVATYADHKLLENSPCSFRRLDDTRGSYLFMVCRFILAERIIRVIDRSGFFFLRSRKNATGKQHQMLHGSAFPVEGEGNPRTIGRMVTTSLAGTVSSYRFGEHYYGLQSVDGSSRMKVNSRKHEYSCLSLVIQSATAN